MTIPGGLNHRRVKFQVANAEFQSSASRDGSDGRVQSINSPGPARQGASPDSKRFEDARRNVGTSPIDEAHASPAPPVLRLPGPERVHNGWDASNVSTAKCDMCHRQRCGTIQKCSECKLSVCKGCAYSNSLQDDGRHVLNPEEVDWVGMALPRGRKSNSSRGDRSRASRGGRGSRGGGRARGQGPRRGHGSRNIQFRAAPSESTSNLSPGVSSRRDAVSRTTIDDKWDEDHDHAGEEYVPQGGAAISPRKRPAKRARHDTGPSVSPRMDTQDVARILVGMPRIPPSGEQASLKRRKYSHEHDHLDNILPPVCSAPDSRQSGYLPSLRTLHSSLTSDNMPAQSPGTNRGFPPLQATPVAYMGHLSDPRDTSILENCDKSRENALFGAARQDSRAYGCSSTAPYYSNSSGSAILYNSPSLSPNAQHSARESRMVVQNHFNDTFFPGKPHGQSPSQGYDERTLVHGNPPGHSPVEPQLAVSPLRGVYGSPAGSDGQQDVLVTEKIKTEGNKLKEAACEIKRSEHQDWPLSQCLRLAGRREWYRILDKTPDFYCRDLFGHFNAVMNCAIWDIGIEEKDNTARSLLCEQSRHLAENGAATS